jgi:hypothetical protein
MKTKKIISPNKLCFTAILCTTLSGCIPKGSENDRNPEKTYRIITIESHEYIFISRRPWGSQMAIAHNANCKNSIHVK